MMVEILYNKHLKSQSYEIVNVHFVPKVDIHILRVKNSQ